MSEVGARARRASLLLVEIRRVPITHPDAARLVEEVQQEYVVRYGGPDETPLDPDAFDGDRGAFFVGYVDDVPVATGAWRRRTIGTEDVAEIKRMYVAAGSRRLGLARAMLAHLETTAAAAGADVMVLETGTAQPEAIALYLSSGYEPVEGFGHYRHAPESRYFALRLASSASEAAGAETSDLDSSASARSARP